VTSPVLSGEIFAGAKETSGRIPGQQSIREPGALQPAAIIAISGNAFMPILSGITGAIHGVTDNKKTVFLSF
jgi:hypothetical protein